MSDRDPPFSLEAEQSVLGSILIDSDSIIEIADFLRPSDFYRMAHQVIYQSILDLYEEHQPTDIVMVAERIDRDGSLEMVGGRAYLASLSNATPTAVHVASYARVVARKAVLRALIGAAGKVAGIAYEDPDDVQDAVDRATEEIYRVSERRTQGKYQALRPLLVSAYEKIDHLYSNRGQVTGIPSGLRDLDVLTHGFQPSDLVILAARPSVGKTSLALNIAEHASSKLGKSVSIFSLEMSVEQLVMRLLSSAADVDSQRLRTGFLEELDFTRIAHAMNTLSTATMFIDDSPSATVTELRTKARRIKSEVGMDLLIIDYLQLMNAPDGAGKDSNRVQEVATISRGLKALARELEVPVLALSQLSRRPEDRVGEAPRLSDLRDSGAIEQDADLVLFLWPKSSTPDDDEIAAGGRWINLKVAKHRNGPTGEVQLWFRQSQTRFYSMEDRLD